ncbi:MAG: ABC transporter permease [Acidobacteria bacterium]|nr:ABC transporter permease [Acidobacteriota bacterium]MCG2815849.1 ABC transporter permease [Candidatus Aminicenantes bacterium]MBU1338830.1 ABC transporter permease [Acidobacteriota bacterium]MBU1473937.1 ABC transporter permease [Acidobacteriota bacterium]MBU2438405.1 ABC transporter permease [Acidobacteriota bacterium]
MIDRAAITVLWLREMKRFVRAKSRIIGALAMPLFFLGFLGMGFRRMAIPGMGDGVGYLQFLVPGILGMSLLFSSTFGGLSVLWDREFGFLKEIMVAPVSRVSIVLGRIAGGVTTSMIQVLLLFGISFLMGFRLRSLPMLLLALVFMILISVTFLGLGLVFASMMKDMQGFSIVMNFVIFPLFFLSGALYPLDNFPAWLRALSYLDPLTYGIDGIRAALIGYSSFSLVFNLVVMGCFALGMIFLGAFLFERSESV